MASEHDRAGVIEVSALLWCAISAMLLLWQAAALARGITFGPGRPFLMAPFSDAFKTCMVVICAIPPVGMLIRWLGRVGRTTQRSLLVQVSVGLAALALSYRLAGLLLFVLAIGCRPILQGGRRIAGWCLWVLALVASVAPVDVTLRNSASHGPRLVPTMNCAAATGETVRAVESGDLVCVANGFTLYYPPYEAVVW